MRYADIIVIIRKFIYKGEISDRRPHFTSYCVHNVSLKDTEEVFDEFLNTFCPQTNFHTKLIIFVSRLFFRMRNPSCPIELESPFSSFKVPHDHVKLHCFQIARIIPYLSAYCAHYSFLSANCANYSCSIR